MSNEGAIGNYGQRMFFSLVGPRLEKFAGEHNLRLEKWFKDVPMWALHFKHPRGGAGRIDVYPRGDFPEDGAGLNAGWTLDDYDSETRRIASRNERHTTVDQPVLEDAILEEIRRVLGWTESDLKAYELPKGIWHAWFSRESFERLGESLPNPSV